jgi:hypothetical protein
MGVEVPHSPERGNVRCGGEVSPPVWSGGARSREKWLERSLGTGTGAFSES